MKLNLNNAALKISAGLSRQFPKDAIPQIAFSGRSNVGKSSLINSLLQRKSLARVSSAPGKTITINFYDVDRKLFLVDLPGYGYAKRTQTDKQTWSSLTDGYFTDNPNSDLLRLRYLRLASIPHIVVATKCDKLNATEKKKCVETLCDDPDLCDAECIILYSSQTGAGREELWYEILAHCNL